MKIAEDLIYDIGAHRGDDTAFYLAKGYHVVAIEANPEMAEQLRQRFTEDIETQRLYVYGVALVESCDQRAEVPLMLDPAHDDWTSITRRPSESVEVKEFIAPTVHLGDLIDCHGVPYYMKMDIECGEGALLRDMIREQWVPPLISVEASSFDWMAYLRTLGYNKFKVINQADHAIQVPPNPPLHGKYVTQRFTDLHTGLFGEETPGYWMTFQESAYELLHVMTGHFGRTGLARGWYDVHARL